MQTCKELQLMCMVSPYHYNSSDIDIPIQPITIPSGTYVNLIFDRWNPNDKMYKVQGWRGMPNEYKKLIKSGVVITYNQVKGKF